MNFQNIIIIKISKELYELLRQELKNPNDFVFAEREVDNLRINYSRFCKKMNFPATVSVVGGILKAVTSTKNMEMRKPESFLTTHQIAKLKIMFMTSLNMSKI